MRSTTTLIALTVALAACGPVTLQLAPTDPAVTPIVTDGGKKDAEPETREPENRPDRESPFEHRDADDDGENRPDREDPFEPRDDDRDEPKNRPDRDDPFEQRDEADPPVNRPDRDADDDDAADDAGDDADADEDEEVDGDEADAPSDEGPFIHPPAPDSAGTPDRPLEPRRPPHIQPERPDTPRPPHIQPERPDRPDTPAEPNDPPAEPDDDDLGVARDIHIPPGHMPRNELCRVWIEGTPPGRQARAVPCVDLHGAVPEDAFVLYDDRVWDTRYDWVLHERRTPGSVPDVILELMRSLQGVRRT